MNLQDEVILAFSPNQYHAFIIAGHLKYHGFLYPNPSIKKFVIKNEFYASVFIRFVGLTEKEKFRLKKYITLMEGEKTLNCLQGALEVLSRGAGLQTPVHKEISVRSFLKKIRRLPFYSMRNPNVRGVLYKTKDQPLSEIYREIKKIESQKKIYMFKSYIHFTFLSGRHKFHPGSTQHHFYQDSYFPKRFFLTHH